MTIFIIYQSRQVSWSLFSSAAN
uniref:Uncharacterized protein n=1 Tax=Anguilla anguilla TaxID=7936 RepID=A0A0E9TGK4_ANGAN